MKLEDLAVLGAAGLAVWAILKFSGAVGKSATASGGGWTLEDLVSQGRIGAYIPTTEETAKTGVTAGSLFNSGIGGGYLTEKVTSGQSLFSWQDPGLWNPVTGKYDAYGWPAYTTARDR